MTNKEKLESLPPETQLHTTLMKFYSCLTDLEKWNIWLGLEYNPEDPAWIHTIPTCYATAAQGKPKDTPVKVPESPFEEMTLDQLKNFYYQYAHHNSMSLLCDSELVDNVWHWYVSKYGDRWGGQPLKDKMMADYRMECHNRGITITGL